MTDRVFVALTFASALGCGLNAGVFFAFSSFVMPALARVPAAQGIAAMNSINVFAVTPVFMTALFGTAAACVLVESSGGNFVRRERRPAADSRRAPLSLLLLSRSTAR